MLKIVRLKPPDAFFFYQETDTFHFPGGSVVNNSAALQETWVQSLGQEDPLEKEMATRSCILVWEVLWTEETGRLQSFRSQRVRQLLTTKQQQLK